MTVCRACNAPVRFVRNDASGKWMILDAEPNADGRIVLEAGPVDSFVAHVLKGGEAPLEGIKRYADHHATCPRAAEFRKPRTRAPRGGDR